VSADPELDDLEQERIKLYAKLRDLNAKTAVVKSQIFETENRISTILRGHR